MIFSGGPAIWKIGITDFLLGDVWDPSNKVFGILPMILASVVATLVSVVIAVPIGVLTAVFLSHIAPKKVASFVRPMIDLLSGIPSVVYGLLGAILIVPLVFKIQEAFNMPTGGCLLSAIVVLIIMILPTIVSMSETALRAVPKAYYEASLGLGATPIRTIFSITIPAARSGILAGVILGVGRAIGETMAVIMVAGNVANMPSLLGSVRFLTTGIAMEMSYASGLHRQALFAIGLVLFIFIMIVNLSFTLISRRGAKFHAG